MSFVPTSDLQEVWAQLVNNWLNKDGSLKSIPNNPKLTNLYYCFGLSGSDCKSLVSNFCATCEQTSCTNDGVYCSGDTTSPVINPCQYSNYEDFMSAIYTPLMAILAEYQGYEDQLNSRQKNFLLVLNGLTGWMQDYFIPIVNESGNQLNLSLFNGESICFGNDACEQVVDMSDQPLGMGLVSFFNINAAQQGVSIPPPIDFPTLP